MKNLEIETLLEPNSGKVLLSSIELFPGIEQRGISVHKGKVRDNYLLGDTMLMVTTDRISTFDVLHPNGIPGKGIILTQMTLRWLELLKDLIPNHLITTNPQEFPEPFNIEPALIGRTMLVEKLEMIPIECVVRGYLAGSGWAEYQQTGSICGILLPPGLVESQKLEEPIFTPATKAITGHDENISFEKMAEIVGKNRAEKLREFSLVIYERATSYAQSRGIIIADTKFEFGQRRDGVIILADEVLTPDSSRFWEFSTFRPGGSQPSFDKQPVRDWGTSTGWDKNPPAPTLPELVIKQLVRGYKEAYRKLFS